MGRPGDRMYPRHRGGIHVSGGLQRICIGSPSDSARWCLKQPTRKCVCRFRRIACHQVGIADVEPAISRRVDIKAGGTRRQNVCQSARWNRLFVRQPVCQHICGNICHISWKPQTTRREKYRGSRSRCCPAPIFRTFAGSEEPFGHPDDIAGIEKVIGFRLGPHSPRARRHDGQRSAVSGPDR